MLIQKDKLTLLRNTFQKGKEVRLVSRMNDPYPIEIGQLGIVSHVDDAGSIHIQWDCGSTLAAIYGADVVRLVEVDKGLSRSELLQAIDTLVLTPIGLNHATRALVSKMNCYVSQGMELIPTDTTWYQQAQGQLTEAITDLQDTAEPHVLMALQTLFSYLMAKHPPKRYHQ
ncbi:hypothetical protein VTH8203_03776 [Vibrio thalassae]|uniref:DUF4314 domain-containing protein n=1 Tax=Vibrio thalassae TaxID=1243014 RepID=A0A240EPF3_9VIBR|nr:DUF4314 domain-containing protein [Vibrio thalassae]SNX50123.1 hypothetical protein VTH8203_03776 [Vibrio thalassae]